MPKRRLKRLLLREKLPTPPRCQPHHYSPASLERRGAGKRQGIRASKGRIEGPRRSKPRSKMNKESQSMIVRKKKKKMDPKIWNDDRWA